MLKGKIQHGSHSLPAQGGNLIPLLPLNELAFCHPGAAAEADAVIPQVFRKVFYADAAGGHKAKAGKDRGQGFKSRQATRLHSREKFDHFQAGSYRSAQVGGVCTPGNYRDPGSRIQDLRRTRERQ